MQEKWKNELASLSDKKRKEAKKGGEEDEDEEGPECEPGSFRDSKVTEFCDKSFPTGKGKTWAVLFYSPSSTSKKAQSMGKVWRALADLVPMHNKRAAVAAIDCSRHRATCEQ